MITLHTKYIEVNFHFIRDQVDANSVIALPHVSSSIQLVDIFTKAMTCDRL